MSINGEDKSNSPCLKIPIRSNKCLNSISLSRNKIKSNLQSQNSVKCAQYQMILTRLMTARFHLIIGSTIHFFNNKLTSEDFSYDS